MVYQVALASKADNTALAALRESVEKLQTVGVGGGGANAKVFHIPSCVLTRLTQYMCSAIFLLIFRT